MLVANMLYSREDLINATKAECLNDFVGVDKVCTDSRDVVPGALFIAMQGENAHGNAYVDQAIKLGATAIMTDRPLDECSVPQLVVKNSLSALHDLARYHRKRLEGKVVGITGSVGKTSARYGLTQALRDQCKVFASEKSYNNHVGMPLSLVNAPKDAEVVICEVGMNRPGEISFLGEILYPDVAIITKIAPAHIGNLGSIEKIAVEKASIFESAAVAIYPAGEFESYFQKVCTNGQRMHRVDPPLSIEKQGGSLKVSGVVCEEQVEYSLPSLSIAWAENSLTILTAVHVLGFNINKAIEALRSTSILEGRGSCFLVSINEKKVIVIDDSYNANPASMMAALDTLNQSAGRKIVVLGSMLELGEMSHNYHVDILKKLKAMKNTHVLICGEPFAKAIAETDGVNVIGCVINFEQVMPLLEKFVKEGDMILFKASNSIGLHKVVKNLVKVSEL